MITESTSSMAANPEKETSIKDKTNSSLDKFILREFKKNIAFVQRKHNGKNDIRISKNVKSCYLYLK
jgi:hypothetical protein